MALDGSPSRPRYVFVGVGERVARIEGLLYGKGIENRVTVGNASHCARIGAVVRYSGAHWTTVCQQRVALTKQGTDDSTLT